MRQLRLKVIRTADDDGSKPATITADQVTALVQTANGVFANADVEFVYDPTKDFTHINSTLLNRDFTALELLEKATDPNKTPATSEVPHQRARAHLAEMFLDRIVVFFSRRSKLEFSPSHGHWISPEGSKHSSAGVAGWVQMLKTAGGSELAHELGHFLQNRHTFGKNPADLKEAAQAIRAYVESGHDRSEGANVFNPDSVWVTDTPPDPRGGLFEKVHGDKCSEEGSVEVPVTFADGTQQTYTLTPDRTNVMSYFRCTNLGNPVRLSPQQALRVRDTLETGLRNRLIAPSGSKISGELIRKADGVRAVGTLTRIAAVAVGGGRVVTVVRSSGKLQLIAWDVGADGATVQRRGAAEAGSVKEIAACYAGLGIIATAVKTDSDILKVILWKLDKQGNITRAQDKSAEKVGSVVSICRVGMSLVATAVTTSAGDLKVDIWVVRAAGKIGSRGSATAGGAVSRIALAESWRLDITEDGDDNIDYGQFTTALRDNDGKLKLVHWARDGDGEQIIRLADAQAGEVDDIALCALPPRTMVSAIRDGSGELQLMSWMLNDAGLAIDRWDTAQAGKVSEIAICVAGVDLVVTAVRTEQGDLKVILWRSLANGAELVRIADATAGTASQISVCQVAPGLLATAVRDNSGNIKVVAWKFQ